MGAFLTTFLFLQIILLFLYKSFIVDVAKKNEKNLVENTLQIYHNTMESVLERLDDNLDLLLGCRLYLAQLNGENNLEKVKAQHQMLQILKERCQDTKEADAYAVVNCKDNSILIQRNGNITYDTIKDIKKYLQKRNMFDKTPTSGWTSTVIGEQVYLVKYYRNLLGGLYRENPVKSRNYEAVKSSKKWENVGNSYIIPALLLYRYSYI